jgi:hypothetical protein
MLSYNSLARDVTGATPDAAVFLCGLRCVAEVSLAAQRVGRIATAPVDILTELLLDVPGETTDSVMLFPAHVEKTHTLAAGVSARSHWIAASDAPCFIISWTVENRSPADYVFELRCAARYNINYISKFRQIPNDTARLEGAWLIITDTGYPTLCAVTAMAPAWHACVAEGESDITGDATRPGQVRARWHGQWNVPAGASATITLALAGSDYEERAREAVQTALDDPAAAIAHTITEWERRIERGPSLSTPYPDLDAFFEQTKLWGYRDTRLVPLGTPFDSTSNGNAETAVLTASPDYHGIFANDNAQSCWEYGALGPAFYPILDRTLEVLYRFGTPESVEIDPFDATGRPWCSPLRIGERPQWVIGACALVLWSGRYLDSYWPRIQAVLAGFPADDRDGDWLDDYSSSTYPEQPDPGPFRHEMLYASAFWWQAFREASKVAVFAGEPARAEAYQAAGQQIAEAIEARFAAPFGYASWLDAAHTQHPHRGHTMLVPLQFGLAPAERANHVFHTLLSPPLWSDDGPLAVEPAYPLQGGAHAWGFTRWNLVHALFRYGRTEPAAELLGRWARHEAHLHFQAPEGFPTVTGVSGKGYAWTAGRALRAMLFGLCGIELLAHGFMCTPRLPAAWSSLVLERLPFRGATYDIVVERADMRQVVLDGRALAGSFIPSPEDTGHHTILVTIE